MRPRTLPNSSDVTMVATGPIRHRCPVVDEIDDGTVTISWRADGATFELHSLAEYLRGFKDSHVSHEEITDLIRHDLSVVPGVDLISVETTWLTAECDEPVEDQYCASHWIDRTSRTYS